MKPRALLVVAGFILGVLTQYVAGRYVTADERALARLYPTTIGLGISRDVRLLSLVQSNDIALAEEFLKRDIGSKVSSLIGLEASIGLNVQERNALLMGQEALKTR